MKKLLLLLLTITTGLTACRKEITRVENHASAAMYDIQSGDWVTDDDSLSFHTSFDVPELSDAIFEHGAVIVYLSFEDGIYEALPEVFQGIAYGAIHSSGAVTVDIHALDRSKIIPPAGEIYAKIVLIDAQQLGLHPGVNLRDYNEVKNTFRLE